MIVTQTNTNRIRTAICDEGIVRGKAIENRRCVFGNFCRSEAEASCYGGIDLEAGCRAANRVLNAVLDIDDAGDLFDGAADAWADFREQGLVLD
jgi:hypothetical protein